MAAEQSMQIVRNGSLGLEILRGNTKYERTHRLSEKSVRCYEISADGSLLAWAEQARLKVISLTDYSTKLDTPLGAVQFMKYSPKNTVLAVWYPFRSNIDENNFHLYNLTTGTLMISMPVKKMARWAPSWSDDESVAVRHNNQELWFYEKNNFERYTNRFFTQKVTEYSVATHKATGKMHIACFSAGTKGQPSFVRLYAYPNMEATLANKSFYKADTISFLWSPKGDAVLLLCATDTDKTGKSYYGEQNLHYMDTTGMTFAVRLAKDGPIHNTAWTPNTTGETLFGVIHGFVPPKVALFNCKSEIVFEFVEDNLKVNLITFNPFGNLVALCGFGNMRGGVHVWDVKRKRKICHFDCPDTTDISWSPDGTKLLSATVSPRLRLGNGIKVWKYIGVKIYEEIFEEGKELYKVTWQPRPGYFNEPDIANVAPNEKPVKVAQQHQKYIPPNLRTKGQLAGPSQKAALDAARAQSSAPKVELSEREKNIKKLKKKLTEIRKLKQEQAAGKTLPQTQLDKMQKYSEIEAELKALEIKG